MKIGEELIKMAEGKTYERGWKTTTGFNIGEAIREHLNEVGEDYVQHMYKVLKERLEEKGVDYWGSRDSFGTYINDLKKLNLIKFSREGEAPFEGAEKRRYYELVEENKDSDAWEKPQIVMYPERLYGGANYREKKIEAVDRDISVRELAIEEHPEIKEMREELGVES